MPLRKSRGVREIPLVPEGQSEHGDFQADKAAASDFDRAFDRLTIDQRDLLLRHHLDGLPIADLALELAVPDGTVKSRLHAARLALNRALEAEKR
jgi:RNA polymerase sigma-70 factor (ECF subfamily)